MLIAGTTYVLQPPPHITPVVVQVVYHLFIHFLSLQVETGCRLQETVYYSLVVVTIVPPPLRQLRVPLRNSEPRLILFFLFWKLNLRCVPSFKIILQEVIEIQGDSQNYTHRVLNNIVQPYPLAHYQAVEAVSTILVQHYSSKCAVVIARFILTV